MPSMIQVRKTSASNTRLHFRDALEEVAFNNVAFWITVHGTRRALLVPPSVGDLAIRVELFGPVSREVAQDAIDRLLLELDGAVPPKSFTEQVEFLMQQIRSSSAKTT